MKNYVGTTTDSGYKLDVNGTGRNPEIKNYLGQKCKGFRFEDVLANDWLIWKKYEG
jgi:hypothetical protein